jgi:glycosyltransferase EpsJ
MKMNKKVSIIIPVYNVEEYLGVCLDSIKKQSYKNIEVLLIDDGSTDNSKRICDQYLADDRFLYFYQDNAGVSSARNLGLEHASGEYVTFIDGDDFISVNHITNMVKVLTDCDVAISGRNDVEEKKIQRTFQTETEIELNQLKLIDEILKTGLVYSFPWNKIYKTSVLRKHNISFDTTLDYGEDLVFNIQYVLEIKRGIVISGATYNYVYRATSASRHLNKKALAKRVTDLLAIKKTIDLLPNEMKNEKIFLYQRIVTEGGRYFRLMKKYRFSKETLDKYKELLSTSFSMIKSELSFKTKLKFKGNMLAPWIMNIIGDLKNR